MTILRRELDRLLEAAPLRVILDLSRVEFTDSTGLHRILDFQAAAERSGCSLTLIRASPGSPAQLHADADEARLPFVGRALTDRPVAPRAFRPAG